MNKEDRENIKQAVAQIIFGLADNENLEGLKEYCTQSIKEALEESKKQGLQEIEKAKENCRMWANEASIHENHIKRSLIEIQNVVSRGESSCATMEQNIEKYEAIKRIANKVANNSRIDGFECSICGCIVKNVSINGKWVRNVRFCPNCGGKNINFEETHESQSTFSTPTRII